MDLKLPRIYPITDVRISGISQAGQVERLIAGGAEVIQLREKYASSGEFYASAKQALEIARKSGVRIIINNRVDIALALKADGMHLGQDDMPPEKAREILGDEAIIGFSTHSIEQVHNALDLPIDYVAIGPIFQTRTKENPYAVVGLAGLRAVRGMAGNIPLVAIGGINTGNLRSVFDAGADSAAMIGAILSDPANIKERIYTFMSLSGHEILKDI